MKRKWNLWLVLVAIIPLAILIGIGLPLLPHFKEDAAEFAMEDDFSKDLRIELPKYKIRNHNSEDFYDSGGLYISSCDTYTIGLEEPLSEESLNILKSEQRGWREHRGKYHLRYHKGYNEIECCIHPNLKYLEVRYDTGGVFWILLLIILFFIPAVGWLIFFLVMSRK